MNKAHVIELDVRSKLLAANAKQLLHTVDRAVKLRSPGKAFEHEADGCSQDSSAYTLG